MSREQETPFDLILSCSTLHHRDDGSRLLHPTCLGRGTQWHQRTLSRCAYNYSTKTSLRKNTASKRPIRPTEGL